MPRTSFKQKVALVAFGLFLGIILLEVGLRLGGMILLQLQEKANLASLREKTDFTILCLGESTTQAGGDKSYPRQLEKILNARDTGITFTVINRGISGTHTGHIVAALFENIDRYNPDVVITMMGINDGPGTVVYEDTPSVNLRLFFERFRVYKLACLLQEHIAYMIGEWSSPDKISGDRKVAETPQAAALEDQSEHGETATALPVENSPVEMHDYLSQGDLLLAKGQLEEAAKYYEKAASFTPEKCYPRFVQIARLFQRKENNPSQAEKFYLKAIALSPDDDQAYAIGGDGLISLYREMNKWEGTEELAKKTIGLNPKNCLAYSELARCYERAGKTDGAIEMYERSFDLNPFHNQPFAQLTYLYNQMGRLQDIERICHRRISINPGDDKSYAALAISYSQQGQKELAEQHFAKVDELRAGYYNQSTAKNYRKLIEVLRDNNIQPICVQYPMRNVNDLKKMIPDQENVIFVDNAQVFKATLQQGHYEDLFVDQFAGDFGHCTPEGNRILADNIADTILEVYLEHPAKDEIAVLPVGEITPVGE